MQSVSIRQCTPEHRISNETMTITCLLKAFPQGSPSMDVNLKVESWHFHLIVIVSFEIQPGGAEPKQ